MLQTRQAAQWYEQQRAGLGIEFLAAVDEAIQQIGRSPERFPRLETLPEEGFVRRHVLNRFPYAIVYEATTTEIRIIAVAHTLSAKVLPQSNWPAGLCPA